MLCTGRLDQARDVLEAFASSIRGGLVPNRFDDYSNEGDAAAHYNTVDASLWFVHAAMQYLHAAADTDAWRDWLAEACTAIVDAYIARHRSRHRHDQRRARHRRPRTRSSPGWTRRAAARSSPPATARPSRSTPCGTTPWPASPRRCPRPCAIGPSTTTSSPPAPAAPSSSLLERGRGVPLRPRAHAARGARSGATPSPTRRSDPTRSSPAACPGRPCPLTKQQDVLEVVRKRLLTPVGLRTLPVNHPDFHPRYTGSQRQRDEAYHQGTIWAWLIGPYAEGVLRAGQLLRQRSAPRPAPPSRPCSTASPATGSDSSPRSSRPSPTSRAGTAPSDAWLRRGASPRCCACSPSSNAASRVPIPENAPTLHPPGAAAHRPPTHHGRPDARTAAAGSLRFAGTGSASIAS